MAEVYVPPFFLPIFRGGTAQANELVFAAVLRSRVRFDAADFCIAKCRTVWDQERLWIFKKNGVAFCTVNFPSGGAPEADGYYLGTVVFDGDSVTFQPTDIFTLNAPVDVDATGMDSSFSCLGTREVV